eukprot:m.31295 g.31295  ORF g.31295 m.31295 type:complete len:57 (-) comp4789_c0_seq1:312-482(-)
MTDDLHGASQHVAVSVVHRDRGNDLNLASSTHALKRSATWLYLTPRTAWTRHKFGM